MLGYVKKMSGLANQKFENPFEQIAIKTLMDIMQTMKKREYNITFLTKKKLYEVNEIEDPKESKDSQTDTKYIGEKINKKYTYDKVSNIINNYLTDSRKGKEQEKKRDTVFGIIGKGAYKLAVEKRNSIMSSNSYYLIEFFDSKRDVNINQINTHIFEYKKKIERIRDTLIGSQHNTTEISLPETLYYCVFKVNNYTYIALINKTEKLKEVINKEDEIDKNITLKQFAGLFESLRNAHMRNCVIVDIKLKNTMRDDKKLYFIDMDDIHIYKDNEKQDIIPDSLDNNNSGKITFAHSGNNKIYLKKIIFFSQQIINQVKQINITIKNLDKNHTDIKMYKKWREDFIKLHSNIFKLCDWCGLLDDIIYDRMIQNNAIMKYNFDILKDYLLENIKKYKSIDIDNYSLKDKNWTIDMNPNADNSDIHFTRSIFYKITVDSILLYAMRFMEIFYLNLYQINAYIEYKIHDQLEEFTEGKLDEISFDKGFQLDETQNNMLKELNKELGKQHDSGVRELTDEISHLASALKTSLKQDTDILKFTSDTLETLSQWVTCNSKENANTNKECTVHLNDNYINFYLENTIQIQSDFSDGLKETLNGVECKYLIDVIKKKKTLTTGQQKQIKYIVAANNINCCKYTDDEWRDCLGQHEYKSQTISIYDFQLRILKKLANNDTSFNNDNDMVLIKPFIRDGINNIPIENLSKDIQDILNDFIDENQETCTIDNVKYAIYILYSDYISDDIQRWFNQQQPNQQQIFNDSFIRELNRLRNDSYDNFIKYVNLRLTPARAMYNQYVYDIEC